MKWLGVFFLPPGWDGSPSQGYPLPPVLNSPTGILLYTWQQGGTVRAKCLSQEHDTTSPSHGLSPRLLDPLLSELIVEATVPAQNVVDLKLNECI